MKTHPSKVKSWNCSHKAIEWKNYKATKRAGDGQFPPTKYCEECEVSRSLKSREVKSIKPVRAWAVVNRFGKIIESSALSIHSIKGRADACKIMRDGVNVIAVTISPLKARKVKK